MEGPFAMMNAEMLRQMQARIQKMQDDLARETVEGTAGGGVVTVALSEIGMGPAQVKVRSIKIAPEAVDPEDVETLEDLVQAAINEALAKAQRTAGEKMSALTGGMKLPGMF
jgi:nucleoid-associated protein EbfC